MIVVLLLALASAIYVLFWWDDPAIRRYHEAISLLQCRLGSHDWKTHQVVIHTEPAGAETNGRDVLLAWGQCKRCAHSKLIHILK